MKQLRFLNTKGDFILHDAQKHAGTYFPLVNEGGMIASVTSLLAGDCKTDQNTYLLAPASSETLHESRASRNFWVRIGEGAPWSVVGQSAPQQAKRYSEKAEETVLAGGLLWQKTFRRKPESGLLAEVLSFVPAGNERIEIMQVALTNSGTDSLLLTAAAAIPLYGRSADNIRDHRHVTSLLHRAELSEYGINLRPTLTFDERGHQAGTVTYRVWGADENGKAPEGFVPLVRDFVGEGSYDWPEAVVCPRPDTWLHAGETAQGAEMIAALFFAPVSLAPGSTIHYQILLSIDEEPTEYLTPAAVEQAFRKNTEYWQRLSGHMETQDARFDAWMRWVSIQPTLRRICGCSFLPHHDYGKGGRGWRDLWQDSLALLLHNPGGVRSDLLSYFAGVRTDGTNATIIGSRPGEFKADRNNIPRVWMDHGFWPAFTVNLYLNETGDDAFLLEEAPYFRDTLAWRGEGKPRKQEGIAQRGTVLEHLLIQNLTAFFDVGEHGHMRLRGADWNDGLDMAAERGESVAFTAAYVCNFEALAAALRRLEQKGNRMAVLPRPLLGLLEFPPEAYGRPHQMRQALFTYCEEMDRCREKVRIPSAGLAEKLSLMGRWIREHIRGQEWVGDGADLHWFNSYYDNSGRPVEGVIRDSVRMMLTGQVFALLSGTATPEQAREIIRSADWYLCRPAQGGYCLNTDFGETKMDMGRMFGFAYGHKENGAVFCHMSVMYAYALYSRGFAAEGYRVLDYLYNQSVDFARSHILPGIPEYFDDRGQGMYPYLTGAASWLLFTMQTQVFGVRGQEGDLLLAPKLMKSQFAADKTARLDCVSAGRRLRVCYKNPGDLEYGEYQIGMVRCKERIWMADTDTFRIAGKDLPASEETVCLEIELTPCRERREDYV